jgi:hypothetical protein
MPLKRVRMAWAPFARMTRASNRFTANRGGESHYDLDDIFVPLPAGEKQLMSACILFDRKIKGRMACRLAFVRNIQRERRLADAHHDRPDASCFVSPGPTNASHCAFVIDGPQIRVTAGS